MVREHLETFLARRAEEGEPMPSFVVDELRDCLRCGVLARGAVRFLCEHCGRDRLVALSCKGRGFCPRCMGRRMTEMAR
ncbi:MAG: transposase zinc-binding domain-containing protein, partial [Deltaproteobacteria bacterium]